MPLQASDLAHADVIIAIDDESANQALEAAQYWGQGCPEWASNKTRVLGQVSDTWARVWADEFQRWGHDPLSCPDPRRLIDSMLAASKEICERCHLCYSAITPSPPPAPIPSRPIAVDFGC